MPDLNPVGVEITDEMVEAGSEVLSRLPSARYSPDLLARELQDPTSLARAVLEAARPFMTSRPALDREVVAEVLHREKHSEACLFTNQSNCGEWHAALQEADAVMALAVPVPTREEVEEVIATKVMRYDSAADVRLVDDGDVEALDAGTAAVLALLNGSAK